MNILILGASYGSLLSTKLLMAGHSVTLVCQRAEADLISANGTIVRIKLPDEASPRLIASPGLPGQLKACVPDQVNPADFDLVALAMQEPQYAAPEIKSLMARIRAAQKPCLSIMNMPPLAYLRRIKGLDVGLLESSYAEPRVWDGFDPEAFTLCSPDPQAFRPPEEDLNFLHVGLPTNFKAAAFGHEAHNEILTQLQDDIMDVRLDGKDVPVKLRVYDSLFVPLAKWSMLLTGNYRAITAGGPRSICEAVHDDFDLSRSIYEWVSELARKLGSDPKDQVPFEKYAKAAESLFKPSSAARAVYAGAKKIERADKLVQQIARLNGMTMEAVDETIRIVDAKLAINRAK